MITIFWVENSLRTELKGVRYCSVLKLGPVDTLVSKGIICLREVFFGYLGIFLGPVPSQHYNIGMTHNIVTNALNTMYC
jgi:hypothetical protein